MAGCVEGSRRALVLGNSAHSMGRHRAEVPFVNSSYTLLYKISNIINQYGVGAMGADCPY